jgi:nucleoside-diphosphate-sugar epimerase
MIVGNGLLARAFEPIDRPNIVFFCSGVSDAQNPSLENFEREKSLLLSVVQKNSEKKIVYFSSYLTLDQHSATQPYFKHKLNMEKLLVENASNYLVVKTTNIVGQGGNKNTLLRFFESKISKNETFDALVNQERNVLDVVDLVKVVHIILENLQENKSSFKVLGPENIKILDLIGLFEQKLNKKALFNPLSTAQTFTYVSDLPDSISEKIKWDPENYTKKLIEKYF